MDPTYFGLSEHPFEVSLAEGCQTDLLNEAHESLFTELRAGLKAPHGITLLIGDSGTGKTVLAKSLVGRLSDTATVAYLPMTGPGLRHLLAEAIEQLGGDATPATDEAGFIDMLKSIAKARAEHGRATVIIVDDAHELPAKTLERLSRLFGDDPADPSMLHIILCGRQELLDRMNAAGDRTVLKHLVQVCRMDPIGPEHSFRYIADRVSRVGGVVKEIFTPEALDKIITLANGIPNRIDRICSAALSEAQGRGEAAVDVEAVSSASAEVDGVRIDDEEDSQRSFVLGEEPSMADPMRGAYRAGAGPLSRWNQLYENRRRLMLYGAGLIALLAGSAALLTGTPGEDDAGADRVAARPTATATDAKPADLATKAPLPEPVRVAKAPAASPLREPTGAPKMVVPRGSTEAASGARAIVAPPSRTADFGSPKAEPKAVANAAAKAAQPAIKPPSRTATTGTGFGAIVKPAAGQAESTKPAVASRPSTSPSGKIVSRTTGPVVASAPAANPAPPSAAVAAAPKPQPAPAKVASAPRPAAAPAPGLWGVQIGAFGSRANAEAFLKKHAAMFGDGRIVEIDAEGKTMFRVLSGGFAERSAAVQREIALKAGGYNTFVRRN